MRSLLQRVTRAHVVVADETIAQIGPGLLILTCAMRGDEDANVTAMADKIAKIRMFADETGKTNRAITDTGGEILLVSQFTLSADTSRGNRPGFSGAAAPADGERLYLGLADALRGRGISVQTGRFGADMAVHLVNDGPMTLWLEK